MFSTLAEMNWAGSCNDDKNTHKAEEADHATRARNERVETYQRQSLVDWSIWREGRGIPLRKVGIGKERKNRAKTAKIMRSHQ